MTPRQVDLEELFERNAETRLLERRRSDELGLAPIATPASPTPARFGPESMIGVPIAAPREAMLRAGIEARPAAELIPGAVVTVVAEVADDGDADADDVRVRVAVPPECEPIAGSFERDGIQIDGDALLGEGMRIGTVPAGSFVRVRFTVRVLPGVEPLDLAVHAEAPGVPAVAAPARRLTRRAGHAAYAAPRPFFELEAGEDDETWADIAPPPEHEKPVAGALVDEMLDAVAAPEPEAQAQPELVGEPEPAAEPEPAPMPILTAPPDFAARVAPAPEPVAEPEPEPLQPEAEAEPEPPRGPEPPSTFLLARVLDADEVRALERVFSGAVPHGLAALALLSSVSATDAMLGRALGVSQFARSVAAALPRALVASRMGRPTPPVVTPEALAAIRPHGKAPPETLTYEGPMLVAHLEPREMESLRLLLARDLEDPFLRGVQVLLAVAPRAVENADPDATERVRDALASYRVAAGAWLMRVTVRRAVDKNYDPLTKDDTTLHEAGRTVVSALREAVA